MDQAQYERLLGFLQSGKLPTSLTKNEKDSLRRKSKNFVARNGLLYYKDTKNSKELQVVTSTQKMQVLEGCHSYQLGGGHFGRDKTLAKVSERYYWLGMVEDVKQFCKRCDQCQRANRKFDKFTSELHPVPVKDKVWHTIGVDLIGPLPETARGNKYIMTVSCYFSKWPEATALPDKTAEGVAEFLFSCFSRHGCCHVKISDQGREFVNQVNEELCRLMGVQCNITSAYHPQSNGLDERFNQTLQRQLLKFLQEEQNEWDLYIDSILFSYRVSRQDSTKMSPFFLMYGRQARLPVELPMCKEVSKVGSEADEDEGESGISLDQHVKKMVDVRKKALENIKAAQERQKRIYDAKHCKDKEMYKVGALVLLKNSKKLSRKGSKMEPNWLGPYRIHEVLTKGTFRLSSTGKSSKVLSQIFNMSRLKLYYPPSTSSLPSSDSMHDLRSPSQTSSSKNTSHHHVESSPQGPATSPANSPPISPLSYSSAPSFPKGPPVPSSPQSPSAPSSPHSPPVPSSPQSSPVPFFPQNLPVPSSPQCPPIPSPPHIPPVSSSPHISPVPSSSSHHLVSSSTQSLVCNCRSRCHSSRNCPCKREKTDCSLLCHPGHTCTNCGCSSKESVDLTYVESQILGTGRRPSPPPPPDKPADEKSKMLKILSSNAWLDDKIVDLGQDMLKTQHPHVNGLQSVVLGEKYAFIPQPEKFVQILNISQSHWIVISTHGCPPATVNFYDSLHGRLPQSAKHLIADLLQSTQAEITVNYMDVQWQSNCHDCGLFALANAAMLCSSMDPTKVTLEQSSMRKHLASSIESGELTLFPIRSRRRRVSPPAVEKFRIYCVCRLTDDGSQMIQCHKCKEWCRIFHLIVQKIPFVCSQLAFSAVPCTR